MSDQYIGECMVSLINIGSAIKKPTCEYQKYDIGQILIVGECFRERES